jgi:hypothetical protein
MFINFKELKERGFNVEPVADGVQIYPRHGKSMLKELQALTELPRRECYILEEDIHEMQVMNAIKESNLI